MLLSGERYLPRRAYDINLNVRQVVLSSLVFRLVDFHSIFVTFLIFLAASIYLFIFFCCVLFDLNPMPFEKKIDSARRRLLILDWICCCPCWLLLLLLFSFSSFPFFFSLFFCFEIGSHTRDLGWKGAPRKSLNKQVISLGLRSIMRPTPALCLQFWPR